MTVTSLSTARQIVAFWQDAGPSAWFTKNDEFDGRMRERFLSLYECAARGDLDAWIEDPAGALALLILLDQFPRNVFRGTPRMYATDERARELANRAIGAGHDRQVPAQLQIFFYLPLQHSEHLDDQQRSVELTRRLDEDSLRWAELHLDIIRRFGRFPHRNAILGRPSTAAEEAYLSEGGFAG